MIEQITESYYKAILQDIPPDIVEEVEYHSGKLVNTGKVIEKRPRPDFVEIVAFPQVWSSTALGFGGIGGQAVTTAMTVVCSCHTGTCVYFGGRLAYTLLKPNQKFYEDLYSHKLHQVSGARSLYEQ